VELLRAAHNPLMVIGGGTAVCPGRVKCVAEKFDLPVINTVNAKGVLPCTHPLAVGGSPSLACIRKAMTEADVILAAGTEFGETDYDMLFLGELELPGKIIRIDIDPGQMARNVRSDIAIVGHADACLRGLCQTLAGDCRSQGAQRAQDLRDSIPGEAHFHPEFAALFATIRQSLPGLVLVGDSTLPTYYAVWQYETQTPRSYFHSATGGGTLGYAIPAAMGAKLARPAAAVVALIGDGSAQFTLSELAAAVEAQLPVVILVWNNQGYSEIRQGMLASGIEPVGVDVYTPDFQQLALAMGCEARNASSLEELGQVLQACDSVKVPTLVELRQQDFISQPAGQWY
jgi:acetolactate synthase-1/2/3 large subunit